MSIWRSKSSNKKSDNKQILKTIKADYSTNLSVLKQRDRINTDIFVGNSRTIIQNNESEHQTQTSRTRDLSRSTLRQLPRFFRLHTSLTKKEESTSAFETPTEWDQKLDREFQSLDIDADGYVSIADLQSVLK
jgi:Ca2+-binding EF-hand superfamily protein